MRLRALIIDVKLKYKDLWKKKGQKPGVTVVK